MTFSEIVTNPENVLAAVVAIVSFATIVTLAAPMMSRSSLAASI